MEATNSNALDEAADDEEECLEASAAPEKDC